MRAYLLACTMLVAAVACGDNKAGRPDGNPGPNPDGSTPVDAPLDPDIDAMVPSGIAEARATADGNGLELAIRNVTVTYLKPQIGSTTNDPAGFTVQAEQQGPALMISVDPATLTPVPEVGDVVSFQITTLGTVGMQKRAQAIANYTRVAQGGNIGALTQNISAASDVVNMIDSYDSEIVTVTGTFSSVFASSGAGFQRAILDTSGISGDTNYQLRVPATLVDALDMAQGCQITATSVPVGRFNAQAQIGVFDTSDFTLASCPAPTVVSVAALSATTVRVTFSRNVLASSVLSDGSQFTFDHGLTATAAAPPVGRTVVVTTGPQTIGTTYTATVANTVSDLQGTGLGTPNTGTFAAFVTPAVVRINEVNANIANSCDLIELRVVSGGSMTGFRLTERTGTGSGVLSHTFPNFVVQTNDLIVVHLNSGETACGANGATQETTSPTDQPAANYPRNYDTAYDFWNADNGLTNTDNVLTLRDAANQIIDAVFLTDDLLGTTASGTEQAAAAVGTANQWDPALPAYIGVDFHMHAVLDLDATGTNAAGTSIQRIDNTDDNNKEDWTTGAGLPSTWGALNVGQTPF